MTLPNDYNTLYQWCTKNLTATPEEILQTIAELGLTKYLREYSQSHIMLSNKEHDGLWYISYDADNKRWEFTIDPISNS